MVNQDFDLLRICSVANSVGYRSPGRTVILRPKKSWDAWLKHPYFAAPFVALLIAARGGAPARYASGFVVQQIRNKSKQWSLGLSLRRFSAISGKMRQADTHVYKLFTPRGRNRRQFTSRNWTDHAVSRRTCAMSLWAVRWSSTA